MRHSHSHARVVTWVSCIRVSLAWSSCTLYMQVAQTHFVIASFPAMSVERTPPTRSLLCIQVHHIATKLPSCKT
jgi:hypothetical protein